MSSVGVKVLGKRCRGLVVSYASFFSFLYDEQEVHVCGGHGGDVGDDRHDLALQAVQELLQPALVPRHLDVESIYSVFHLLPFTFHGV